MSSPSRPSGGSQSRPISLQHNSSASSLTSMRRSLLSKTDSLPLPEDEELPTGPLARPVLMSTASMTSRGMGSVTSMASSVDNPFISLMSEVEIRARKMSEEKTSRGVSEVPKQTTLKEELEAEIGEDEDSDSPVMVAISTPPHTPKTPIRNAATSAPHPLSSAKSRKLRSELTRQGAADAIDLYKSNILERSITLGNNSDLLQVPSFEDEDNIDNLTKAEKRRSWNYVDGSRKGSHGQLVRNVSVEDGFRRNTRSRSTWSAGSGKKIMAQMMQQQQQQQPQTDTANNRSRAFKRPFQKLGKLFGGRSSEGNQN